MAIILILNPGSNSLKADVVVDYKAVRFEDVIAKVDVVVGGSGHFERFTTRLICGSSPITSTP